MGKKLTNKQERVYITLCPEDAAKARILCARKGLPFPKGLSFLVKEVVHPEWKEIKCNPVGNEIQKKANVKKSKVREVRFSARSKM